MVEASEGLRDTTAFVTGGSGFIGSHLSRALVECGADVHVLSRQNRAGEGPPIRWWQGDVTDRTRMLDLVRRIQPDVIFHLASTVTGARDRSLVLPMLRANLLGSLHLLDAADEVDCRRVVLAGSLTEPARTSEVPPSPYAAAKWSSSIYARMYHGLYGTPAVVLRLGMVYGPAQPDLQKLVPYVTISLLNGEAPDVSSGDRRVDWVYVDDVVDGLIRGAVTAGIEGKTIDVGAGTLHSIRDVVEQIADFTGGNVRPTYGARPDRPLEQEFVADSSKTRMLLKWKAQTSLSDGLQRTVDWYRTLLSSSKGDVEGRLPIQSTPSA